MSARQKVSGCCPACGNDSLFLGDGGHVTCSIISCPKPSAVTELLADREREHLVQVDKDGRWTCRHPLKERLEGDLFGCPITKYLSEIMEMAIRWAPGLYRVTPALEHPGNWNIHRIGDSPNLVTLADLVAERDQ